MKLLIGALSAACSIQRGWFAGRMRHTVHEEQIPRGDRVLVYPYQPLYYFLTATSNSTQFEYLHLGLHAPEHMERAILELEADRTPTVIYAPAFNSWVLPQTFPATSQKALDSDPVRDYIFAHYRVCKVLPSLEWPYAFMRRRDLPCPTDRRDVRMAPSR
jgi:hypothetical protein